MWLPMRRITFLLLSFTLLSTFVDQVGPFTHMTVFANETIHPMGNGGSPSSPHSSGRLKGEDCVWGQGRGEVALEGMTPQEARSIAVRQARAAAIEDAIGLEVKAKTLVRNFDLLGEFLVSLVKGYVTEEHVLAWKQRTYQASPIDPPIPILAVELKACVVSTRNLQDHVFSLALALNKSLFVEGDKVSLKVKANRRAYLSLFNLSGDDRVHFYHQPPVLTVPIVLEPGETLSFPRHGIVLEASLPSGFKRSSEAFIAVATAKDTDFFTLFNGKTDLSLAEFYAGLLAVQCDVVEAIVPYTIERR